MFRRTFHLALLLATVVIAVRARAAEEVSPSFSTVPELSEGFHLLYAQQFQEARQIFQNWESEHYNQPFGEVALAASYLFEELYRQNVLSSDFFLDEKRFLHGIDGKPTPERMSNFRGALAHARDLAKQRMRQNPKDPEALFALRARRRNGIRRRRHPGKEQLDGLKRMKEANEYAKQLLVQEPGAADAYVALGAANYIIGSLNPGYRALLWFGGIHGDKRLGMEQLSKTAESGRYLKPFAKILLALSARREKQNGLAQRLLLELSQEFPDSALFASEYAKAMGRPIPAELDPQH